MPKICLDAGHNAAGADAGAEGNGLREQDLTLDITLYLKFLLTYNGFEVVMTANNAGADLFLSLHVNAGGGTGTEVYALPGGQAEKLAGILLNYLGNEANWAKRGVKTDRKFYVLVNTLMPAVLTENGFIDNQSDAVKLRDPEFRKGLARAHAQGVCDFYGVTYQEPGK